MHSVVGMKIIEEQSNPADASGEPGKYTRLHLYIVMLQHKASCSGAAGLVHCPIRNSNYFANIWRLSVHTDVIIQKILNRLMARILKDNPQHAQKPTQESYFFSVK